MRVGWWMVDPRPGILAHTPTHTHTHTHPHTVDTKKDDIKVDINATEAEKKAAKSENEVGKYLTIYVSGAACGGEVELFSAAWT